MKVDVGRMGEERKVFAIRHRARQHLKKSLCGIYKQLIYSTALLSGLL